MGKYRIASDELQQVHVLSPDGDSKSLCGWNVSPYDYEVKGHVTEVTRLLIETIGGCRKCATVLMGSPKIQVGIDRRYAEQHKGERT